MNKITAMILSAVLLTGSFGLSFGNSTDAEVFGAAKDGSAVVQDIFCKNFFAVHANISKNDREIRHNEIFSVNRIMPFQSFEENISRVKLPEYCRLFWIFSPVNVKK